MGPRVVLFGLVLAATLAAQDAPVAAEAVSPAVAARQWREGHEHSILEGFFDLLRIPNTAQNGDTLRKNAEHIAEMFDRRGVRTQLLELDGAAPVVFGELGVEGAVQTLVFYAHYDGQPVKPGDWYTGDPFKPTLFSGPLGSGGQPIPLPRPGWPSDPEWRIYARSAGDDKAPIIALATALDALRSRQVPLRSNLKFFFEGEEESGSPHLVKFLEKYKDLLSSNAWFFCDGPVGPSRQPEIIFGVRGITGLELAVYGPRRELHSGHYGNWAPNPAMMLARLLASMKDENGRVLVEGFYDDVEPLGQAEEEALAALPDFSISLMREFWLPQPQGEGRRLEEVINQPSLNIRGFVSGAVGEEARNVIPAIARASIDIRLVKGMDHAVTVQRVLDHIRKQGFFVTDTEPAGQVRMAHARVCKVTIEPGYNAARTPMDSDLARTVIRAIERARGPVIKLPTMGGSLPLYAFNEILGSPAIVVPIANHDDNQHTSNENLRLQNLWDGMETMAALLALDRIAPAGEPDGASEAQSR